MPRFAGKAVLGKKVGKRPPHLVTRGTRGARRTDGTSQTSDAIFARSTINTFGTSITLKTWESLRPPVWSKEVTYSVLLVSGTPPQLFPAPTHAKDSRHFRGKGACLPKNSLEHRLRGPALCRGMNKGFPIQEEAPPLVAMATHGERRAWTTGTGFISKKAREEEERIMKKRKITGRGKRG